MIIVLTVARASCEAAGGYENGGKTIIQRGKCEHSHEYLLLIY